MPGSPVCSLTGWRRSGSLSVVRRFLLGKRRRSAREIVEDAGQPKQKVTHLAKLQQFLIRLMGSGSAAYAAQQVWRAGGENPFFRRFECTFWVEDHFT
jgi:hypothetical protein